MYALKIYSIRKLIHTSLCSSTYKMYSQNLTGKIPPFLIVAPDLSAHCEDVKLGASPSLDALLIGGLSCGQLQSDHPALLLDLLDSHHVRSVLE